MSSSSAVVTPGLAAARNAWWTSATTRPARRIARMSSSDLYSTPRATSGLPGTQRVHEPLGHLGHLAHAVDLHEQAALGVALGQRRRLILIHLKAAADDDVGVVAAALLGRPAQQALHDGLRVDGQLHNDVEGVPLGREHLIECPHLFDRARVSVEQEAFGGVWLAQAVGHHAVGDLVGHVLPGVHVALGTLTELGAFRDVLAEDVARGNGGNPELLTQPLCLGAFTRAGGAEKYETHAHRKNPSDRKSTRLNSSHVAISYAVFCLKQKKRKR